MGEGTEPELGARPLRGRRGELATIRTALGHAVEGRPGAVVLVGEPGIGKSRLAMEAAAVAQQLGFETRWGRAWEAGGAPAYWPWRQICDGLPRDGAIAQIWGGRAGSAADPEHARFELFDAVTRGLAAACATQPQLCILDDLHAADVPSLELVAFATRHLRTCRLAWLLAWRDAEARQLPVRDQLVRIAREARIVSLGPLAEVEANELIDDVRGDANIELRSRLVRTTAGNPLFLLETLAALASGHVLASDEQLPLAQGIAAIVDDRLAPLPAEIRRLAQAASVVGRDVELARWAAAADCDVAAVRSGASRLVATGVLGGGGHDRWRFAHDLVREAIYRRAGDDVLAIHQRLAAAFDAEIAGGNAAVVGERVHHGLHARLDTRTLLDWTIAAADHARSQCAYEEAASLIERTLGWLGAAARHDAALQLARGRALLDLGTPGAAREAFASAITLARAANDPRMVAAAVLAYGARYVFGERPRELIDLIDAAMAALPAGEHALHARLLARKAAALTPAIDSAPVLEMARRATELIANTADTAARLEVAVSVGAAFADFVHPRERIPINEEVVTLARAEGDRVLELRGLTRLVTDHVHAGDFATGDAVLAVRDELARALQQPRFAWMEPLFRSQRAMIRGDFAICDAAVDEALAYASHDPNAARACAVHRAMLFLYSDRLDALRAHEPVLLDALRTMGTLSSLFRIAIRARCGELVEARRAVDALEGPLPQGVGNLLLVVDAVAEGGPEARCRELYDQLAPFADTYSGWGPFAVTCGPPIATTLGRLAGALGEPDRARAHFESALAMTTATGATVGRVWTLFWYGRMLARLGDATGAALLEDAAREAAHHGLPHLAERCRSAAIPSHAAVPVRPPAPPAAASGLAWSIEAHAGAWQITVADRSFLVPNLRGMAMLARLAAMPHVEVHSLELVSGTADAEGGDRGDAGELLDDQARAAYRKRLAALAEVIEDAEARGDVDRAEAARDEHEALVKELSRAVGLHGRVRRAGAAGERARITAQRRLREAIRKIAELDAELGTYLDRAVRTGTFCVYRP
jgi:tetratricopeptide (TPR) repeat protein